jgi:hypothetical protein
MFALRYAVNSLLRLIILQSFLDVKYFSLGNRQTLDFPATMAVFLDIGASATRNMVGKGVHLLTNALTDETGHSIICHSLSPPL